MRGSDSTTAMSSRRPPMTAGPIERKRRFLSAVSYGDWAKAPAARPESASATAKMEMGESLLEGMRVSLNVSYCTSGGRRSCGRRGLVVGTAGLAGRREWIGFREGACAAGGRRDQGVARRRGRLPHIGEWVGFGEGIWVVCFGLRCGIGFVWYFFFKFGGQGTEAFEFLDGAAVVALGLGLVTQEESPGMRLLSQAVKTPGDGEIVVLAEGDRALAQAGHLLVQGVDGLAVGSESLVEASGEEAGFETRGADEGQLAEGDAFDGPELLGVGGVVEVEKVVAEVDDLIGVFEMGDSEDGAGEAMFAGVLSGLGLAGGGTGAGGLLRVDAIGCDLFVGGHGRLPFNSGVARRARGNGGREGEVVWNQQEKPENRCERRAAASGWFRMRRLLGG